MRVLFASWAGGGHFAPLVPLGWALRAAGHEVLVACHPSETGPIVAAGLGALPAGPDVDMFALLRAKRAGQAWRPRTDADPPTADSRGYAGMVQVAEAVADALADDVMAFCRTWSPDLVVYEPASLVGPLVARVQGIPAVRQLWTCDFTAPVNGFPATVAGALARRFGVTGFDTAGDLTLDPCPPRLQVRDDLPRQPIRYVPYNGPAVEAPWLRAPKARRRICVTWGTSLHSLGAHRMRHVARVVRAMATLDAEIVVAVLDAHREFLTDLPDNVRAVGPVPLHLLLPSCDAVVHQGGGGTLMTAAAAGVPQVVVPSIADQIFNAGHLAVSGAGIHVPGGEDVAEAAVLAAVVAVMDDPSYRDAATRLCAEHLARPTPAEVVAVLERLARDYAGPVEWAIPTGALG
jgi:UDP:flavonoid glycosyltransferase YjiC (YdhE family)